MLPLVKELWPEHGIEDLEKIVKDYIGDKGPAVFAESIDGWIIAVALCSLRHDYVEGCGSSLIGYLEGIFVHEDYRMKGIASSLCKECENWAKETGCSEFASDCELTNTDSLHFHL